MNGLSDFLADDDPSLLPSKYPAESDALPVFLEEPKGAYASKGVPAVLACKVAHALKVYFTCDEQHMKPDKEENLVDPETGIRLVRLMCVRFCPLSLLESFPSAAVQVSAHLGNRISSVGVPCV